MTYKGSEDYKHDRPSKVGVLITNLGTPNAPTASALRPYLKEFLSDPRVVEFPRLLWWFVLNVIILNIRPARSAKSYKKVWTDKGSPLAQYTKEQAEGLEQTLKKEWGDDLIVKWAMRYGSPSIHNTLQEMLSRGVEKLLVLPLYPQYSASTTASTFDAIAKDFTKRRWLPELRFVASYYDHQSYIDAVAQSIKNHWQSSEKADHLLFSYHGVPKRYLLNGDPYHCQCLKTTRLIAEKLGLSENEYSSSFQSRFGREEWLKPYTDHTLQSFPEKGIKSVQVVCPGFSSDCLETVEEIDMENREYFLEAGGERFEYIPALNASDIHINALHEIITQHLQGWDKPDNSKLQEKAKRRESYSL